jgi:hypothetical protein
VSVYVFGKRMNDYVGTLEEWGGVKGGEEGVVYDY